MTRSDSRSRRAQFKLATRDAISQVRSAIHAATDLHLVLLPGLSTIHNALRRIGLPHQKSLRVAEQDRPDVATKRCRWRSWQPFMDPARFVFLDETASTTNMARRYGHSPSEQRLVAAVPRGHQKTTTFLVGLRQSGVVALLVLGGPITGTAFHAYVEQFLAPTLEPGDVVVLDNLAAHKVDGVRQAIAVAGASILYLLPYSPALNPIQQLFAKLKALLRRAAARTRDELWSAIGLFRKTYTPAKCANDLRHSGHGST